MAIALDYTPMEAVGQLALAGGYGQYRQQQVDNQFRQQQLAQQAAMQQQQIAAQQYGQMQSQAHQDWQQQQQLAAQQQYHQAMIREQNLRDRFGMYGKTMGDIADMEQKGFQYAPDQQKQIARLDQDWQRVQADPAVNQEQRGYAEAQYYAQRSKIRPTQPAPKTKQQILDESVAHYTFGDGTTVPMVVGERNGMPHAQPIENPNVKQDQFQQKMEHQQQVHEAKIQMENLKLENTAQRIELDRHKAEESQLQKQQLHEQTMLNNQTKQVSDAYYKMRRDQSSVKPDIGPDGGAVEGSVERKQNAFEEAFKDSYGKRAQKFLPDIAQELGLGVGGLTPEELKRFDPQFYDQVSGEPQQSPGAPQQVFGHQLGQPAAPQQPAATQPPDEKQVLDALKVLQPDDAKLFESLPPDKKAIVLADPGIKQVIDQHGQLKQLAPQAKANAEVGIAAIKAKFGGRPPDGTPEAAEWDKYQRTIEFVKGL